AAGLRSVRPHILNPNSLFVHRRDQRYIVHSQIGHGGVFNLVPASGGVKKRRFLWGFKTSIDKRAGFVQIIPAEGAASKWPRIAVQHHISVASRREHARLSA